jgi:hypothetical protein
MAAVARRSVLAAIVLFATIAAPAQATIRQGAGSDAQGDSTGNSGHDIVAAAARADDSGRVAIAIKTAAAPSTTGILMGGVGTQGPSGCGAPFMVFAGSIATGNAIFIRDSTPNTSKAASMSIEDGTVTFVAEDPALALPFDCAEAIFSKDGNTNNFYDTLSSFPLAVETAPAPTPTATPAATVAPAPSATPVPAPTTATTPPVPVAKAAKLTVSLGGAPSTIRRNRTLTLKLKVANDGSKRSSKVTIGVGKARGLSVRRVATLSALKPAQKRTVTLRVKLSAKARASTTLKVTARAGKLKASSSLLLRIGKVRATPAPKKSPIAGTFWWRNVNHVDWAWDNRALYFVDGGSVYSGFPKGGLPTTCTTPVAEPDEEFDTREGCLPYTFDVKSGAVTIGDKAGTFKDGKLTIDGEEYTPTVVPEAGARFTINEHKHASFRGMCGLILGCTTSQEYLSLSPDGKFILTRSTVSTMGDPGIGPWTAVGSYPPDQQGTYEILAGGKIRLAFADGSVREELFLIDTNRQTGAADPLGEGVFIGEDNFYPPPA